jgi:hypothetical protein
LNNTQRTSELNNWNTIKQNIANRVLSLPQSVFLVTLAPGNKTGFLTLHTLEQKPFTKATLKTLQQTFNDIGYIIKIRQMNHRLHSIQSHLSIESLIQFVGKDIIAYDPTFFYTRSRAILDIIRVLRRASGGKIQSAFIDAKKRSLILQVTDSMSEADAKSLMKIIDEKSKNWQQHIDFSFDLDVLVCRRIPTNYELVAIDDKTSGIGMFRWLKNKFARQSTVASFVGLAAVTTPLAFADVNVSATQDVYKVSTKLDLNTSDIDSSAVASKNLTTTLAGSADGRYGDSLGLIEYALPLSNYLGVQINTVVASEDYYGFSGQLFLRDSSRGLLGLYVSKEGVNSTDMTRAGLNGEIFIDRLTLGAGLGSQSGSVKSGATGSAKLRYYFTPDLLIGLDTDLNREKSFSKAGVEWRPGLNALPNLSVFADMHYDNNGYDRIMVGLKLHFGTNAASLMDRDRLYKTDSRLMNLRPLESARGY